MTPEIKGLILLGVVKFMAVFITLQVGVMMVIWAERRGSGFMQDRLGPNRVGPFGLLQSVADGIKNMMKEETAPTGADRTIFFLAPAMSFVPALMAFAVVPFAAPLPASFDFNIWLLGRFVHTGTTPMMIADVPVGFLYILALGSLAVYGVTLAGWASNSKYAFLGGVRAAAQMISYEIPLGMSLIVIMMLAGNVTLSEVVRSQQGATWFIFPLTLAFLVYFVSAFAETNRLPFDLPETESELITGYHTEYSSMKFSLFFIAEYTHVITQSALFATLFFGGWDIPFTTWDETDPSIWKTLATLAVFSLKTLFFIWVYIWIRWTLPRFRYDQLMQLGWKFMLPLSLGYIVLIATIIWLLDSAGWTFGPAYAMVMFAVNAVLVGVLLWGIDSNRLLRGSEYGRRRKVEA